MYTVKHVLSCHFSLSLSYSHSLSFHLSLPSHLLHHLCSCNKQDSSCALFHSLAFSSLLVLAHPPSPGMASPAWLFDWLVCVSRWSYHAVRLPVCSNVSDTFSHTHYVLPLCSKPSQLTQQCFHLLLKACCKRKCDNFPHALSVACTQCVITLNYSNKTKTPSSSEECTAQDLTIQVFTNSTLLIWASHHTDIPLSWVMEKSVWNIACDSLGLWFK